jgi:ribosomal protein L9
VIIGLGKRGDKVSVKRHYGYNSLLLPKLAVYATPENEKMLGTAHKSASSEVEFSSKEVPRVRENYLLNFQSYRITRILYLCNFLSLLLKTPKL